jgi:hypothetical protein
MITARTIWKIIRMHMPRKRWVSRDELYDLIELHGNLQGEDWKPPTARSMMPRWKVLVRDVMANRLKRGRIRSEKRSKHAQSPSA